MIAVFKMEENLYKSLIFILGLVIFILCLVIYFMRYLAECVVDLRIRNKKFFLVYHRKESEIRSSF